MRPPALLAAIFVGAAAIPAAHAWDPRGLAGGRLRLGGEASFSMAAEDRGFFNYTDYRDSWLRMARLRGGRRVPRLPARGRCWASCARTTSTT